MLKEDIKKHVQENKSTEEMEQLELQVTDIFVKLHALANATKSPN
jgi:hypothetical protein